MNYFKEILKELPISKLEIVQNDENDQKIANQMIALINWKIIEKEEELKILCHQMSYGDNSKETFRKFCDFFYPELNEEERELKRQEIFND